MYPILALQETVSELTTLNLHCHTLYAGLIAFLQVGYGNLIAMSLSPAHIHTHKHLRPVLTLRTTGSGVNLHDTVHRVFLLPEHILQLKVLDGLDSLVIVFIHLLLSDHLLLVEVECQLQLICELPDVIISYYPFLDALDLLHLFLCTLHVLPEVGCLRAQLLLLKLHFLLVYV